MSKDSMKTLQRFLTNEEYDQLTVLDCIVSRRAKILVPN